jgi:hypothetical protein
MAICFLTKDNITAVRCRAVTYLLTYLLTYLITYLLHVAESFLRS